MFSIFIALTGSTSGTKWFGFNSPLDSPHGVQKMGNVVLSWNFVSVGSAVKVMSCLSFLLILSCCEYVDETGALKTLAIWKNCQMPQWDRSFLTRNISFSYIFSINFEDRQSCPAEFIHDLLVCATKLSQLGSKGLFVCKNFGVVKNCLFKTPSTTILHLSSVAMSSEPQIRMESELKKQFPSGELMRGTKLPISGGRKGSAVLSVWSWAGWSWAGAIGGKLSNFRVLQNDSSLLNDFIVPIFWSSVVQSHSCKERIIQTLFLVCFLSMDFFFWKGGGWHNSLWHSMECLQHPNLTQIPHLTCELQLSPANGTTRVK